MSKVKITQVRSTIDRPKFQKLTMQALGLKKMNATVEKEVNSAISGMLNKVAHLVKIEQI
jgi:large subunit ribosomal protein L30